MDTKAPPWSPTEMAELLDSLATAADRLELSYSETAHITRNAASTVKRLQAENERLQERIAELYRSQKNQVLSAKSVEYNIDELQADNARLREKLTVIHEISQENLLPAWQVIENIAATASSALAPQR